MAVRGSVGLLPCVALLLAMPALAATPTDRGECAASADKPDIGFAACGRIIDDASVSMAERIKTFKSRGRGFFNSRDYDRAIADYGEAIKLSPKDASAYAHRCEAYESKEDHDAAIADCTEAIKIDPWCRLLRSARIRRGAGRPRRGDQDRFGGCVGPCPPRHGVDGKG
jgi:tetratricopeptide (TPR) repeat protein